MKKSIPLFINAGYKEGTGDGALPRPAGTLARKTTLFRATIL
jgi:hypothetical protein